MFGKILKKLREDNLYSMDKLVSIYNKKYDGKMNKSTLSRYENGLQEPMFTVVVNLAELFGVTVDYLTGASVHNVSNAYPIQSNKKRIPVLGCVAAGIPIEAIEDILDYEELDCDQFNCEYEYFGLKIKGDSMSPRIQGGDVVIVRKQSDVDSGDVAIVCVNGDNATCKQIKKHSDGISLIPYNTSHEIKFYSKQEIETLPISIIGKVVELRGKF